MKKVIDLEEVILLSRKLADKVRQTYKPDVIFAIANGGIVPGIEISEKLKLPLEIIEIRRKYDKKLVAKYEQALPKDRAKISKKFDDLWFASEPKLLKGTNRNIVDKKVLLADDVVHTGKTSMIANDYINSLYPAQIKTAALFYVKDVRPDYYLGQGEYQYPWATWARFYPEYRHLLNYLAGKNQRFL